MSSGPDVDYVNARACKYPPPAPAPGGFLSGVHCVHHALYGALNWSCLVSKHRTMSQRSVAASPEWVALQDHYKQVKDWHMRDLFEQDPKRFEKYRLVGYAAGWIPSLPNNTCIITI